MSHEENAAMLAELSAAWRLHHEQTRCAEVQCTGDMAALRTMQARYGIEATAVICSAVYLLAGAAGTCDDQDERIAELGRLLEVQRGLTADAAAQAIHLDADLVDAHGQIAGLEQRVSGLLAELTAWEESAGVIGLVLPVADHG